MKKIAICFIAVCLLNSLQAEEKVLVCLHGFMRAKSNMSLFRYKFKKEGWNVHVWQYPSKTKTIEEHSEEFVAYLDRLKDEYPGSSFCYATHSMGALILRAALGSDNCPEEARTGKAVLIAPPNRGSSYGRFLSKFKKINELAGPNAGKQLLLTEKDGFDYLGVFPESVKVLVIAGTCGCNPTIKGVNDGKVGINETRLPTPHLYKEVFASHSWICHTPKTVEIAMDFLEEDKDGVFQK
ncbi:MAG: hypothetical protein S4CHLAM37_05370 [Chlamydiia bacterium]|nr:hypothetical protein [Chlamydiia bacterium]